MKAVKAKFKQQLAQRQTTKPKVVSVTPRQQLIVKKQTDYQQIIDVEPLVADPKFAKVQQLLVAEDSEGQRLDNFLIKQLKGVPKSFIYRIVRDGQVRVNKKRASVELRLVLEDVVRIPPLRISNQTMAKAAQFIPTRQFDVLYEDDYLLAINKPSGLAVHGGSGVQFGVIEQLRRSRPQAKFLELVHRLDRETSGILLIAKKRSCLIALQQQFAKRTVQKSYLAMVAGSWQSNNKVIDLPLYKYSLQVTNAQGQSQEERRVQVVTKDDERGQRAISLVKVQQHLVSSLGEFSLLTVTIKTGRTHQIRVHLQSQGHAIVGDAKYGDFSLNKVLAKNGLNRMFLHAWQLKIKHPKDDQLIDLVAPLPDELQQFIDKNIAS